MAPRTAPEPAPVPGARWVPLTQGNFALVDEADFARISAVPWCAVFKRDHWYAERTVGPRGARRKVAMHRDILGMVDSMLDVDHRNGDTLDNRRNNLRPATDTQNRRNSRIYRKRSCAYKGVTASKVQLARLRHPWQASIKVNGKRIHLGRFATAEEAARAYDAAAREHFGEFARFNFPKVVT